MAKGNGDNRGKVISWLVGFCVLLAGCLFLIEWGVKNINSAKAEEEQTKGAKKESAAPIKVVKSVMPAKMSEGWMPEDQNALRKLLNDFFKSAEVSPGKDVIALISPHAGYAYSGQTAAYGIKMAAQKKYSRIIVIGPSHQVYMPNTLSVPKFTHYETALGEIPLDTEFINKLLKQPMFKDISEAYRSEHSVFMQLPLLQYRMGDFKLVPIVAGNCSPETIQKTAEILSSMVDSNTLIVASSDFTHYGPNYDYVPFKENVPEELKKLDMGAYDYISKIDSAGFQKYCDRTGATICGRVPIAILLAMLPKEAKPVLLKYTTSGELMHDYTNSVSYFSIVFNGEWQKQEPKTSAKSDTALTQEDKDNLLKIARKTIEYYLQKGEQPNIEQFGITITDSMNVPRAAFVTLKENNQLRGCIGELVPRQALYKSVAANAINAAVNDYRFTPVKPEELSRIEIEISALTPPKSISSYNQIRLGTDGVILEKNGRSAVFLPQVATEQNWTIDEMLDNLSMKAGLPSSAWKEGASFHIFQAEVFGEKK